MFKRLKYNCDSTRSEMFAIGHFALGYLTGKATSKLVHVKVNLPILLAISVIPDIDLLLWNFMDHRGLTHSIIVITVLMIPLLVIFRKAVLPYATALLSHVFLGDFFTGGIEFLWPITKEIYGYYVNVNSLLISAIELGLFLITLTLMYKLKDLQTLLKPGNHNIFLIIPFGATLGPFLFSATQGDPISILLVIPSLFWLGIFTISILNNLRVSIKSLIKKAEY